MHSLEETKTNRAAFLSVMIHFTPPYRHLASATTYWCSTNVGPSQLIRHIKGQHHVWKVKP